MDPETPYTREAGYAERYQNQRFAGGTGPSTDRREAQGIAALLHIEPATAGPWLDMPAGTGRLSGLLPGPVVQVDRDLAMIRACRGDRPRICASALRLPFVDAAFAGGLCMRLLHHIPGAAERRRILGELARVCHGPVIVSFFHSVSLQHLRRVIARRMGKTNSGRRAVRWKVFREDLHAAGFRVVATRPLARFISEQWLVLVVRNS